MGASLPASRVKVVAFMPGIRVPVLVLLLLAIAVIVGPWLLPGDPIAIGDMLDTRLLPPLSRGTDGHLHLLGTDRFGRDLLNRMLLAGRISLSVGIAGSLLSAGAGVLLGATAGWIGGLADRATVALADTLLSIPRLVLLLVFSTLWTPGLTMVVAILVATGWMGTMRLVRAEVQAMRSQPFVEGARALGTGERRLLFRHVLPNAIGPAIVAATLGVGNAILLESGLSFLGLGVQPPTPSWGNMIAGGRDLIVTAPWVAIMPGVLLVLTVLAATLLGDAVRDWLAGDRATAEP
ncbi:MAG TPA: ABC transporter permease [Gemmatimonadales bacterium]|nr:ABC transporter permease [Gemmatimonadales bacterium]